MDAGNKQLLSALLAQLETKDKQIEILLSTNAELVQEIKRVVSEKDAILAGKLPTTVIASSSANGKSPTPKASAQPTQSTPASLSAEAPKPKQKAPQKSQQTTTAKPNATVNGSTEDLEGAEAPKRKGKRKVSDLAADSSPKVAPQLALEVKQDAAQSKQPAKKKKKGSETQTKAPIPVDADKIKKQSKSKDGGLAWTDTAVGTGPAAAPGKKLTVAYKGYLRDGTKFDESSEKGFTFRLGLNEVIKGWDKGLLGMKVGGSRKLVVPPQFGYGPKTLPQIPANSTLCFDVELLHVA